MMRSLDDLIGKNIVVFDLEICKTIEECGGWDKHDKMGISVGCAYDYRSGRYRVFMQDNMQELCDRLNEPDTLVVAFNNINFDNKLLRASGHPLKSDTELKNCDMLLVSRGGAGVKSNFVPGFKLDDHLRALGLPMKTGDGAQAPILWKEGKVGAVVDYCLQDVRVERLLFESMYVTGKTSSKHNPEGYEIELPAI